MIDRSANYVLTAGHMRSLNECIDVHAQRMRGRHTAISLACGQDSYLSDVLTRHVEQDSLEAGESETTDDEWSERGDATRRNRDGGQKREPDPGLQVGQAFPDMVPAPCARGDTLLVHTEALNGDQLLFLGQEASLHG